MNVHSTHTLTKIVSRSWPEDTEVNDLLVTLQNHFGEVLSFYTISESHVTSLERYTLKSLTSVKQARRKGKQFTLTFDNSTTGAYSTGVCRIDLWVGRGLAKLCKHFHHYEILCKQNKSRSCISLVRCALMVFFRVRLT